MTQRSHSSSGGRRSGKRSGRRAPIVLLALLSFLFVLQVSVAGTFRSAMPQLALPWVPLDAEARSRLAAALAEGANSAKSREIARRLATEAIRRDALSPVALRVLAQTSGTRSGQGDRKAAALMLEAERLTRRDRAAQLWFVQYYIGRGDIPKVMRHFDIALRTSDRGRSTVFPLLAAAAGDQALARALTARLNERPVWAIPFMVYLIDEGSDPARTVAVARAVLDPKDEEELGLIRSLLQRLGARDRVDLAWQVYTHFGLDKSASAGFLQDGDFESASGLEPFAWMLIQDTDLWAARQRDTDGSGSVLQLGAASGRSGEVARQAMRLGAGRYRLDARMGAIPDERGARPRIEIRCAGQTDADSLLALAPTQGGTPGRQLAGEFSLPGDCEFQWLSIQAAVGDGDPGEYPWVDDIRVSRLGA